MSTEQSAPITRNRHIIVVCGPAGCGKTSYAKHIAEKFNLPFMEGDQYHSQEAIAKMARGTALEDADRWGWLARLNDGATGFLGDNNVPGVVMTCSALKQAYRDVLRGANDTTQGVSVHFIFLDADPETLMKRLTLREDHFMSPEMLNSQLAILETAGENETDVVGVDVRGGREETEALVADAASKILST
ncbi:hypothetical protein EG328_001357 [Venturia inaequalis]|uniref:Gluconokinase n=1 Tax=Venturia inaequalis TaxID=5025 RepID=A0A8H3YYC8_VENIN|nr:hypothetical protein EG328_001357 [Venturia inaequalis]